VGSQQLPGDSGHDDSGHDDSGHDDTGPGGGRTGPPTGTTRRGLLKGGLIAGVALGAGGWRTAASLASEGTRPPARRTRLRRPGSRPHPGLAAGTDTIPQIKHIVVLMMENHSYDNHLGMLRRAGADGFTLGPRGHPLAVNPYADGSLQHAFRMPNTCQLSGKPSQTWDNSHLQFARGKLDGFVQSASGPVAMGYWQQADLPFYYSLASQFPIADRYFCSVLGPTFPNRRYLISATSLGMANDTVPGLTEYPANGTIFDHLHAAGVTWKDYFSVTSVAPTMALYPPLLVKYPSHLAPVDDFFSDAKAGTLPGFSLVEPNYLAESEEDPQDIALGERFAAQVIDAIMSGPGWKDTLLIWTYDEHGGYYDHVVPPAAIAPDNILPKIKGATIKGFELYGFRVPCAVISPWSRARYVSHQVFDHTSICALVEAKWNLPAMTRRDANAHDMLDMLDFTQPTFLHPPKLAKPLLDSGLGPLKCLITGPGMIPPLGSVTPAPH
jgi:phospholipase C